MARLRYNGLSAALGASLTNSATSVTFAAALTHSGGTAVPTISGSDYIPLSIIDLTTGRLSEIVYLTAYTAGATTGTITRGRESTTGVTHASGDKVIHAGTVLDATERGILTVTSYNPGTIAAYTTIVATDADMDATNLAATFTVPSSGKVLVTLDALAGVTAQQVYWTLRQGTTTLATASTVDASGARNDRYTAQFLLTGLTPGASVTIKWGFRLSATTGSPTGRTFAGGVAGPATMKVESAP